MTSSTDFPKQKRLNESKYTIAHNDIFQMLESGYSVTKIVEYISSKYPENDFKTTGVYSYIRQKRKDGKNRVLETTKSKAIEQNTKETEETVKPAYQPKKHNPFDAISSEPPPKPKPKQSIFD